MEKLEHCSASMNDADDYTLEVEDKTIRAKHDRLSRSEPRIVSLILLSIVSNIHRTIRHSSRQDD